MATVNREIYRPIPNMYSTDAPLGAEPPESGKDV